MTAQMSSMQMGTYAADLGFHANTVKLAKCDSDSGAKGTAINDKVAVGSDPACAYEADGLGFKS